MAEYLVILINHGFHINLIKETTFIDFQLVRAVKFGIHSNNKRVVSFTLGF